jgi:prepilin-type N-terminal cleavage/methylation domain-containing protein
LELVMSRHSRRLLIACCPGLRETGSKEVTAVSPRKIPSQSGLTLAEILVVVSIVSVVGALSIPSFSRALDNAKLKSAAQQMGGLYEDARIRAAENNTAYEVLVTPPGTTPAQACIDLNGDGQCSASEPQTIFPRQVVLNNNVPQTLAVNILGFDPQDTEKSHMVNANNVPTPGLAWNSRGVPCERIDATSSPCSGIRGWVQYLQLPRPSGEVFYAAVTVSPSGRVKTWIYIPSGNGNGNWF